MADYDIVVVGAGPAGAAFVRRAKKSRHLRRIAVIDQAEHPRDKICGDALTDLSIALLADWSGASRLTPSANVIGKCQFCFPDGTSLFGERLHFDIIPRRRLDADLWKEVRDEVKVFSGTKATELLWDDTRVAGVRVAQGEGTMELRAHLVVGADGSLSVVRRETRRDHLSRGVAVRQYLRDVVLCDSSMMFFLDPEYGGYFWVFPFYVASVQWANIGYFIPTRRRVNPLVRFREMKEMSLIKRYVSGGVAFGPPTGFPLNLAKTKFGRVVIDEPIWGPGYVLIGDAAALVHPYTGEGIASALYSGTVAAELLDADVTDEERCRRYSVLMESFFKEAFPTTQLAMVFSVPSLLPSWMRELYVRVLRHWFSSW